MNSNPTPASTFRHCPLGYSLPLWPSFHPPQRVAGGEVKGSLSTSSSKSQQPWGGGEGPCYLGLDETKHSVIRHSVPEGSTT